jgi:hypothetical protein
MSLPMDHAAFMKKSWGLVPKVVTGEKTCEGRWYKSRRAPWNKSKPGDTLYFKNGAEPISLKVTITKVFQYKVENNKQAMEIMKTHVRDDLGTNQIPADIKNYIVNKNYSMFLYFNNVKKVKPFEIDKKGFGAMTAWISLPNIETIKI